MPLVTLEQRLTVTIGNGMTSATPAPDAVGVSGSTLPEAELEGIDERLVRDLAERVRCQRLRNYLQRTAGRRRQAEGRSAAAWYADNVDDRIFSPRPVLAHDFGL
jgi:hypothetical protein